MFGSVSIRTDDWRFTRYEDGALELFDVAADPDNLTNLATEPAYADTVADLRALMILELAEVDTVIDEGRGILITGEHTYYINHTSDLTGLTDPGGYDLIISQDASFTLPDWAEDARFEAWAHGGQGFDGTIIGNALDNHIAATRGGDDFLRGGKGNDVLSGYAGKDRLHGNGGDDTLLAGDHDDRLRGGEGRDRLDGGHGDDCLFVEAGDTAIGGRNSDLFMVGASSSGGEEMTIADLKTNQDRLVLHDSWNGAEIRHANGDTILIDGGQRLVLRSISRTEADDLGL